MIISFNWPPGSHMTYTLFLLLFPMPDNLNLSIIIIIFIMFISSIDHQGFHVAHVPYLLLLPVFMLWCRLMIL
jgi:hypothetical protein